jgi:hypothetical protein
MMADLFELARPELMARHNQPDLFGDSQPELFAGDAAPVAYHPDPDRVRRRLRRILAEARAAATVPWEPTRAGLYRTIVPQMTLSLPDEEAAQWRLDFEAEMARLDEAA